MICPNCGKEVGDGLAFCSECGTKILASEVPNNVTQPVNSAKSNNLWEYFVNVLKEFYFYMITGRSRRAEFWGYTLFYFLFAFAAAMIDAFLFGSESLFSNYVIAILGVPAYRLSFRRMHDVGKPAGFTFIPIYGFILSLLDSEQGTNKYGPNPKA